MPTEPRFATPRTPDRQNLIGPARGMARALGVVLMPWQEHFVSLFTELRPDGHFAYKEGTLLVSRQSGKSSMALVLLLVRCLTTPNTHCVYGAQTLKDSRSMLMDTWEPVLRSSGLAGTYKVRAANGSERITFANGSSIALLTSTSKSAGHGQVIDLAVLDEAFSYVDSRSEVAMIPAMSTRSDHGGGPQLLITSTAGTPTDSVYLLEKTEKGRQLASDGVTAGTCYVEYSAPEDSDMASPEVWAAANPAYGITITEEVVQGEWNILSRSDFARSRLNMWVTSMVDPVVPLATWDALEEKFSTPGEPLVFAFDSSPDGSWSSIAVAGRRADNRVHVEVIENREGVGWLGARLNELIAEHQPRWVVVDAKSPAAIVLPELAGANVRELSASDATAVFASFVSSCSDGVLVHREQPILTRALVGAVRRPLGDAFAWSRRNSGTDISPIVAASEAAYIVTGESMHVGIWSLREVLAERAERERLAVPI